MSEWISVDDRLPEDEVEVLIFYELKDKKRNGVTIEKITHPADGNLWSCTDKEIISHWMPLPNAPDKI